MSRYRDSDYDDMFYELYEFLKSHKPSELLKLVQEAVEWGEGRDDEDLIKTDLITKIQNGIKATDADDVYSCGMRNGMRWCISLIDEKGPLYENCPSAQAESWLEQNKDKILQAGMEGREIEFHIGGRLFAIREKAQ